MTTEPDLRLGGVSIWVDGRQFPNVSDYSDGNWLIVRVRMDAPGASVKCDGAILMTTDIDQFRVELNALSETLTGEATLGSLEPQLKATLKAQSLGHIVVEVEISPDHLEQFHRFTFNLDQSYLPPLIAACERILERYPVIGVA
jgi:hypothetical protein